MLELREAVARRISGKYWSESIERLDVKSLYKEFYSACGRAAIDYGPLGDLQSTKMYWRICDFAKEKDHPVFSTSTISNATSFIVVGNKYGQCVVLIFVGTTNDSRLAVINTFENWPPQGFAVRDMYDNSGGGRLSDGVDDLKKILKGEKL